MFSDPDFFYRGGPWDDADNGGYFQPEEYEWFQGPAYESFESDWGDQSRSFEERQDRRQYRLPANQLQVPYGDYGCW